MDLAQCLHLDSSLSSNTGMVAEDQGLPLPYSYKPVGS